MIFPNLGAIISLCHAPLKTRRRRRRTNKWPSRWMVAAYYEIKTGGTTRRDGEREGSARGEDFLRENNKISLITRAVIVSDKRRRRGEEREDPHLHPPSLLYSGKGNSVEIQISIPSSQYPTSHHSHPIRLLPLLPSIPLLYSFFRTPILSPHLVAFFCRRCAAPMRRRN